MRTLSLWFICLFLTACDVVTLPEPAGGSAATLSADTINGAWVDAEGDVFHLLVLAEPGTLQIGAVGEEDGVLGMDVKTIAARSVGDRILVSALASGDDDDELAKENPRYVWALLDLDDAQALLWLPDRDRLASLVEANEIPGEISEGDVHLGTLSEEHWQRILDEGLFLWDEPVVLRRVD